MSIGFELAHKPSAQTILNQPKKADFRLNATSDLNNLNNIKKYFFITANPNYTTCNQGHNKGGKGAEFPGHQSTAGG